VFFLGEDSVENEFLLRREPFGGILAEKYGEKVKFLNPAGYEITLRIAKGLSDNKILEEIASIFEVTDIELVKNDIHRCRAMTQNSEGWDSFTDDLENLGTDDKLFPIPTLSAPLDLHWEVTNRCNLFCMHCYNRCSTQACEPDLDQIRSVVSELQSTKLRNIVISGGEPLMRRDIKTIFEQVRPLTSVTTLSTNGTLITDTNSRWFPDLVDVANLSLDVGSKEGYEQFRGKKGSFDKCLQGLRILLKREIPVAIQTTISRFNIDRLEELANLILAEGATSWIVRLPVASGRAVDNRDYFLSWEELVRKEPYIMDIRERYLPEFGTLNIGVNFAWTYKDLYRSAENEDKTISCAAGTVLALLKADGRMAPCPLFADTNFNSDAVWNNSFLEQWRSAACMQAMRSIKLSQIPLCYHCADYGNICSTGCRAKSCLNGNLFSPDPDCGFLPDT
jgi:Fe-coproporphyrin III synthase